MSRATRTVTAATAASLALLVAGLVAIGSMVRPGIGAAPPTTAQPATAASVAITAAPESSVESTTTDSGFADGAAASLVAEELLPGYIESQHRVEVTDPACSEPPTGAVGETFACYALKPGDLVIALRATIGEERLLTLELITNQNPTTTTTEPAADTTEP